MYQISEVTTTLKLLLLKSYANQLAVVSYLANKRERGIGLSHLTLNKKVNMPISQCQTVVLKNNFP